MIILLYFSIVQYYSTRQNPTRWENTILYKTKELKRSEKKKYAQKDAKNIVFGSKDKDKLSRCGKRVK